MASSTRIAGCVVCVAVALASSPEARDVSGQRPAAAKAAVANDAGQERIDPRATDLFKRMSDYLARSKALSVRATFREEVILLTGQKLEYESSAQISLRRPDRLRTSRHGILEDLDFYYDGKTVTVYRKQPNFYAVQSTSATVDSMLDAIRSQLDIEIPGSDLLYADAYPGMIEGVTDGMYVGLEDVGGVRVHHLAFRQTDVDWQIWIQEGDKPVPVKYVINTKWMTGGPSIDVVMTDWDLAAQPNDETFTFLPPAGARKIEFKRPPDLPAASK